MADSLLKILVSRLRFIGDIVLTTPVIETLREKFPDAEIDYLGDREGVTLLENNPNLTGIIPYDFAAWEVGEQLRVAMALRKRKYDVAIDLFGNPRSAMAIFLSGAKKRIGGDFGWRGKLFTHPITVNERISSVAFHLRYLAPLGVREDYRPPRIYLLDEEISRADKLLAEFGIDRSKDIVGLHLGATWPAKIWPPENFAALAEMLVHDMNAQVVVTYGPNDVHHCDKFSLAAGVDFVKIPPGELRHLGAIISRFNVYVSNDAAPMHISAAVGTPTIGIFGPGDPVIWFPYEESLGHSAMHKDVECCHRDFCRLEGEDYLRCMKVIRPEEVAGKVEQALRKRNV